MVEQGQQQQPSDFYRISQTPSAADEELKMLSKNPTMNHNPIVQGSAIYADERKRTLEKYG